MTASLGGYVEQVPIYSDAGSHAPALAQNLRAAAWVLLRSDADTWHFVFAPNARTSEVGRWLRRVRRRPVLQTIASPPRSFSDVDQLLFGDIIVAQSRATADSVKREYGRKGLPLPDLRVIPPPVPAELQRSPAEARHARERLGIAADVPLFVYPGDLEVSSGARVTQQIAARLKEALPDAVTVFAYRRKTPRADEIAERLRRELDPASTRLVSELPDLLGLLASATAVLFPVDDLYGKVDLPVVLLEAMVLSVPVVALGVGPLLDLGGAELVPSLDVEAWVERVALLAREPRAREERVEAQRALCLSRCDAAEVARAYEELYFELCAARESKRNRFASRA
jgi:phosphatidylinositol alpha-1,6-mannosyltransferase